MKKINLFSISIFLIILFLWSNLLKAQNIDSLDRKKEIIYLIAGQGADWRSFQYIDLQDYDTIILPHKIPIKNETLPEYALRMSAGIDTTQEFSLIGVSFGGMICTEISKFLKPRKVIIISSAKGKQEFPFKYRFLGKVRLYKLFSGNFFKNSAQIARPIFEPVSRKNKDLFWSMINDKNPKFMKRSIHCIMTWDNTEIPREIIHIHGTNDHTIPYKNIHDPVTIVDGSHMMIVFRAEEISKIILRELKQD